ncbi:MAG TPA: alpha/beta fold hydrolase [Candidatus Sulfotelmatobacter sp.]|jgi:phospholipase/carboxylesterase|nr:alpha/beta fold hydrolase [Candidatus Sulfotelmatobacter sp.]
MLTGPTFAPASGGPARQLVVFLHGLGSNGDDLIELAPYFAAALPDAAFFAPDGHEPCDMAPFGRQWFSLRDQSPGAMLAGVESAAVEINAFIDAKLAELNLSDDKLVLVGFSQGTMLALHIAVRRPAAPGVVIGFSGLVIAPERLLEEGEITARPPILLIHGEQDEVVPHGFLSFAQEIFEKLGLPVLSLSRPDLGHSIDDEGLKAAIAFTLQNLG